MLLVTILNSFLKCCPLTKHLVTEKIPRAAEYFLHVCQMLSVGVLILTCTKQSVPCHPSDPSQSEYISKWQAMHGVEMFVFASVLVCWEKISALFHVCASGSACNGQHTGGNVKGKLAARTQALRKRNDRKMEWKFTAAPGNT